MKLMCICQVRLQYTLRSRGRLTESCQPLEHPTEPRQSGHYEPAFLLPTFHHSSHFGFGLGNCPLNTYLIAQASTEESQMPDSRNDGSYTVCLRRQKDLQILDTMDMTRDSTPLLYDASVCDYYRYHHTIAVMPLKVV